MLENNKTQFNVGLINNIHVLYTYGRVDRKNIDETLYVYDIQSLDDGMTPSRIAREIKVNHYATIISNKSLLNKDEIYKDIQDSFKELDSQMSLDDFINQEINHDLEMRHL